MSKEKKILQYEIKVTGKVQGVGFRYYTQNQAKILNLTGFVRNTVDQGVLAIVQGEKAAIETLSESLWIGPPLSQVTTITQTEMQLIEEYEDFTIQH